MRNLLATFKSKLSLAKNGYEYRTLERVNRHDFNHPPKINCLTCKKKTKHNPMSKRILRYKTMQCQKCGSRITWDCIEGKVLP